MTTNSQLKRKTKSQTYEEKVAEVYDGAVKRMREAGAKPLYEKSRLRIATEPFQAILAFPLLAALYFVACAIITHAFEILTVAVGLPIRAIALLF